MSRPGSDGPENVDATFEEIVADLRAQGFDEHALDEQALDERDRTDRERTDGDRIDTDDGDPRGGVDAPRDPRDGADAAGPREAGWRESPVGWDETMFGSADDASSSADPDDPDEHFVPPEPPPLPKPRKGALMVLVLFVLGLLLLIAPSLVGLSGAVATPLGMLSLAAGLALLLLRVRQGPPDGADPSNGAQV